MKDENSKHQEAFTVTDRTRLKRIAGRGSFDRRVVYSILDEALVAHVSFVLDGRPASVPMAFARIDDGIVLHGSTANRMMRAIRDTSEACVTITLLDGLVLARSAFHHSVNFRSVIIYGRAVEVTDPDEKLAALVATVEHVVPGRYNEVRGPSEEEFARTMILRIPLVEVSAKLRSGAPIDEEDDYDLDVWAGEIPLLQVADPPVADTRMKNNFKAPRYATHYRRPKR